MPSLCIFELFKQPEVYFVGERIEGTITLITTNDKHIQSVNALLRGEEKVRYQENCESNETCKLEQTVYKGNVNFFLRVIRLDLVRLLRAGSYKYNIKFTLDDCCLTSCESERGCIRYEIFLTISRVKRYHNVFKHRVTVINHANLDISPSLKPIKSEINKNACCRKSKKSFCILSTPIGVYAPGQVLKYTLEIRNTAKNKIEGFLIRLLKKMSFISKSPVRKICTTKNYIVKKFLAAQELSDRLVENEFLIPATPPTTLTSKLIYIEYMLEGHVLVSCCSRSKISAEIPIAICAVPIKKSLLPSQVSKSNNQVKRLTPSAEQKAYKPSTLQLESKIYDCNESKLIFYVHIYLTNSSINELKRLGWAEADDEAAAVNLPFQHYEEPSMPIRGARKEKKEPCAVNSTFMDYDKRSSTFGGKRTHEKFDAVNLPSQEPAAPQTGAEFVQLLNKEPSMAHSAKKDEKADPPDFPLVDYEEKPTTSRKAMKHKLYQSYEEQPSTSHQAKKNKVAAAHNLRFMNYEEEPSRCYACRRGEKLVACNIPLELNVLRKSKRSILPPSDDDIKPTSFELEPYTEPNLEDRDVPKYGRLEDFRPLYPVYRPKSQPEFNYPNFDVDVEISEDGYLRLTPEIGLPPSENLIENN